MPRPTSCGCGSCPNPNANGNFRPNSHGRNAANGPGEAAGIRLADNRVDGGQEDGIRVDGFPVAAGRADGRGAWQWEAARPEAGAPV